MIQAPVANVIKLFTAVIYEFSKEASVCPWKGFPYYSNKHSSFVRKFINYRQKSFITLAPGVSVENPSQTKVGVGSNYSYTHF